MLIFKKMSRRIILSVIFVVSLASCSEFLVVEPEKQVSIVEQFSTKEGVHQAINGFYYSLESLHSSKFFIYGDLVGGNLTFAPSRSDQIVVVPAQKSIEQVYEFRDLEADSDYSAYYAGVYKIINEVNLVIANVKEHPLLSPAEIDQITAEALACRGYAHYMAAIVYAQNYSYTGDASHPGIVYNTSVIIAGGDYPSRSSMAESYALMKADMEAALALFGSSQALPYGPSYSYFNPITTAAVYAKMALQMNDWATAYRMADTVISHSGAQLMEKEEYVSEWEKKEEPVSEIIFELSAPRTSDEGTVSFSLAREFFGYVNPVNYLEFVASGDLLEMYDSVDIRSEMFMEIMLPTSIEGKITSQPYYFTKKFQDDPGIPVCRLSEMYLIRAEAGARMESAYEHGAIADLNEIRERAGLEPLEAGADLLEEIFRERRRELAFENFLFYDIARYHKDIVRNKGCISAVCNLPYPSDYYVLPIPASSVTLNENMQQNEGYN
jgi:hypothetical protein